MDSDELAREIARVDKRVDNISKREIIDRAELVQIRGRLQELARDTDDRLAVVMGKVDEMIEQDKIEAAVRKALKDEGPRVKIGWVPRAVALAVGAVAIAEGIRALVWP